MTMQDRAKGITRGYKQFASKAGTQAAAHVENGANLKAAVVTSADRDLVPDSRLSNPAKALSGEKNGLADQLRTRIKTQLNAIADHIRDDLLVGLVQLGVHGTILADATATLPAMKADAGALIAKLGMLKASGWKLWRLTDSWMVNAKAIQHSAEVAVEHKAPAVLTNAGIHHVNAEFDMVTAKVQATVVKDEIHRVAEAFALDAQVLTAIIQLAATVHSNGKLSLASTTEAELSGLLGLKTMTGGEAKHTAMSHTFVDMLGGTIRMTLGQVHINPLIRALPDIPVVVPPVINPTALTPVPSVKTVPQYEGVNAHGTSIV